ncbi:hypothetical protein L1987_89846 [Smallanthus sonchifolius]|nr:hypothetical protein L1987_89846 [Smallanthus sonchifolius]
MEAPLSSKKEAALPTAESALTLFIIMVNQCIKMSILDLISVRYVHLLDSPLAFVSVGVLFYIFPKEHSFISFFPVDHDDRNDAKNPDPERGRASGGHLVKCSRGCKPDGTRLGFGRYGTKSCRAGRLSYRAIEAARRARIGQFHRTMSGQFRINGKIWVRVLADLPITGKPTEVRMGRGKGNPTGWIARVPTGQIPFEMDDVSLSNARQAATLAAHKLCSSTKFSGRNVIS